MTGAKCYVYAIEVDGVIRYIGKGTGRGIHSRFNDHMRSMRRLIRCAMEGLSPPRTDNSGCARELAHAYLDGAVIREIVIADSLSSEEAFHLELTEIKARKHLWNRPQGGNNRGNGWHHSDETKDKMSQSAKAYIEANPSTRTRLGKNIVLAWQDEEFRKQRVAQMKEARRKDDGPKGRVMAAIGADGSTFQEIAAAMSDLPRVAVTKTLYKLKKLGELEKRDGRFHKTNVTALVG